MNDTRKIPEIDSPRPRYAERHAEALVAQYLHELSDRHTMRRPSDSFASATGPAHHRVT